MYNTKEKLVIAFFTILNGLVILLTLGLIDLHLQSRWHNKYAKAANERWRINRAKNLKVCELCNCNLATEKEWHMPHCANAPHHQLVHEAKLYQHNEQAHRVIVKRLKKDIIYWQGKFNMVRHENNKLRAKIR